MLTCTLLVLLIAPAVALLAMRAPAPLIATAQALGGAGMGIFSAVWLTTLQQHVPEEALSRVSAWDWMGSFLFLPLGLIAAGPVADLIGVSTTLWISVAWAVLSTLVVVLVPSVRNLRRLDEPQEPGGRAGSIPGRAGRGVPWRLTSRSRTSSQRGSRSRGGCTARRSSPRPRSRSAWAHRSTSRPSSSSEPARSSRAAS